MIDKTQLLKDIKDRMNGAVNVLENDLKGLRTGRASINLVEPVVVEAYGDKLTLSQLSSVSVADARTLSIQVWDKGLVKAVEKAIVCANLGLVPIVDGQLIRVPIPALNEDRRKELVKIAHKYGENTKIACRNVRRDGNEELKKLEKNHEISKDEHYTISEEIQKIIDDVSKKIDNIIKNKEQEILTV